jgi:hypothetical protein
MIATLAEWWAEKANRHPESAGKIAEAAEDLADLLSTVLGDDELWPTLPASERDAIATASSKLGTISEQYHTRRAAEEHAELQRRWMRQMNLRKESA